MLCTNDSSIEKFLRTWTEVENKVQQPRLVSEIPHIAVPDPFHRAASCVSIPPLVLRL